MTTASRTVREGRGTWSRATDKLAGLLSFLTSGRVSPDLPVFVAATYWTVNGVNVFSANLVRGLNRRGWDARVLITEEETDLVTFREPLMPLAADIPFESLALARTDSWGSHWGRMVRFLSDRAPCIYIPNSDWRHSCVGPRLPSDVVVVGIVHSDDPLHYDHLSRLGDTWNAIVAVSAAVAQRSRQLRPTLADRITNIPIGARVPKRRPQRRGDRHRLRLIYHGVLKQHQKRVLDLPLIVHAAVDRGVPVELTIVGGGPDEELLRASAAPLVERDLVRFCGVAAPDDIGALLAQHDVYLLASEFEGLPNALIEAMGQGCVPVVTRMTSGVPEVVRDGENGFLVPIGDAASFADRLHTLWSRPDVRERLSKKAFRTVSASRYQVDSMVASYEKVFRRARAATVSRRFVRPMGELARLPTGVAGVSVFPLQMNHYEAGIGWFPTEDDLRDFERELTADPAWLEARPREAPIDGMRVFIACPVWTDTGVNLWAEDLARGLRNAGLDARLLLTEESTELVQIPGRRLDRPDDVPCELLTLSGPDVWGARWGATIRLLERSGPCFYVPHYDWRHSCVTPLLSTDVMVAGIVHSREAMYLDHTRRLGRASNAIVATNREALSRLRQDFPELADRMSVIAHGLALQPSPSGGPKPDAKDKQVLAIVDPGHTQDFADLISRLSVAGVTIAVVLIGEAALAADRFTEHAETVVGPNRQQWLRLCAGAAIVVGVPSDGQVERMMTEAMAHGSVPVPLAPAAGAQQVRTDDRTGLPAPSSVDGVAAWVARIVSNAPPDAALSSRARAVANDGRYASGQMIASFLQLFRRIRAAVERGDVPERWGRLEPPQASIEGVGIFPVPLTYETALGAFPSESDARRFEAEAWRQDPL